MKNFIFTAFFLLLLNPTYSQLAGKKSKDPYKSSIDGYTYKLGDKINIGFPSKGEMFQNVLIFDYQNGLTKISNNLNALNGNPIEPSNLKGADKLISQFNGEILFFQIIKIDNKNVTFAVVDFKDNKRLAIAIEPSLSTRELVSLSPEYRDALVKNEPKPGVAEMVVKSFDPNYIVKITSINGNREMQTVTITYTISHKLSHQEVYFNSSSENLAYDFDGNSYPLQDIKLGLNSGYFTTTQIPTNILIKGSITFKQVLPEVGKLSYLSLKVHYGPTGNSSSSSNMEITNMKIDWN